MQVLLPDPVYVPQEATPADLVTQLLRVMLTTPSGWLLDAAQTAFPDGTKLLNVTLAGGTAIVNLGGAAAGASADTLRQMSAQLLWPGPLEFGRAVAPVRRAGGKRQAMDGARLGQPGSADRSLRLLRARRRGARQLLRRRRPGCGAVAVGHGTGQRAAGRGGAGPGRDRADAAHPGRGLA